MKLIKKFGAIVAAAVVASGAALVVAPAASATDLVDCAGRSDFYETIKTNGTYFCFANYGDLYVTVYDTITLSTGNNDGWITYTDPWGYQYDSTYRPHWYVGSFSYAVTTNMVHLR